MNKIPMDIETIPAQTPGVYEQYLQDARENFKAPSSLTKTQAAQDLNITDAKEIKYTSKDELINHWIECFREEKAPELAEHEWRKTALDGGKGEVISVCCSFQGSIYSNYRTLTGKSEYDLVGEFFEHIRSICTGKAHQSEPFFIGHNIPFDIKFLYRRAVILGIEPGFNLYFNGIHGRHYFCNSQAWCTRGDRISQNNLAACLGIEQKPDDIDGSKVWDFVKARNEKRVAEYNKYDVETVAKIYQRLNFDRGEL